jgi:hypothetical protein
VLNFCIRLIKSKRQSYNPPSKNINDTTTFFCTDIFNGQTCLIGSVKIAISITTCTAELAMKNAVVLMHFFSVTVMSQNALTGLQDRIPTRAVSKAQAILVAPIILVAKSIPGVGKSERYKSKMETLITTMAMA